MLVSPDTQGVDRPLTGDRLCRRFVVSGADLHGDSLIRLCQTASESDSIHTGMTSVEVVVEPHQARSGMMLLVLVLDPERKLGEELGSVSFH